MKPNQTIQSGLCLLTALASALVLTACKNIPPEKEITMTEATFETIFQEPESLLYYGEILELIPDEQGHLSQLLMDSPRDGRYAMNLGPETHYIDSGERRPFDPQALKAGDRVYVFHSPMTTRSLPPQSPAFVVLRNIPMDASCAMYHLAEEVRPEGNSLLITTDQGQKTLKTDQNTVFLDALGQETDASQLKEGSFLLAWYWGQGETVLHSSHLMLLPRLSLQAAPPL